MTVFTAKCARGFRLHLTCLKYQVEGGQPLASPDDCLLAEEIVKADPGIQQMLKDRGCTDLDLVACDPWSGTPDVLMGSP